jgi:hypothetical protein
LLKVARTQLLGIDPEASLQTAAVTEL